MTLLIAVKKVMWIMAFPLLLATCNKPRFSGEDCLENCIVFKGTLIDTPSANKISGAELKFYYHNIEDGPSIFNRPVYLGITKTDNQGNYSFRFNAEDYKKRGYFEVYAYKNGYFVHPYGAGSFQSITSYNTNKVEFDKPLNTITKLYKETTLSLRVKSNQEPLPFKDFQLDYTVVNGYKFGFNIQFENKIDTLIELSIPVGIPGYLSWEGINYPDRPILSETDTLYSQNGEKLSYEIVL